MSSLEVFGFAIVAVPLVCYVGVWFISAVLSTAMRVVFGTIRFGTMQLFKSRDKQPREREVLLAARGVTMMIVVGIAGKLVYENNFFGYDRYPFMQVISAGLCIVGIAGAVIFVTGMRRSRGYRDSRLIAKYLFQIGLGALAYVYRSVDIHREVNRYSILVLTAFSAWCLIIGLVKLALVLRGVPRPKFDPPDNIMVHGDAGFGTGEEVR